MIRLRHKILIQAFRVFDQMVLVGTFILLVAYVEERGRFTFILEVLAKSYRAYEGLAMVGVLAGWFFIFGRLVHYDGNRVTSLKTQSLELVKATTVTSLLLLLAGAMFYIKMVTPMVVSLFWVATTLLLIASRMLLRSLLRTWRKAGRNRRHVLFLGGGASARSVAERMEARPELGYEIIGFLDEAPADGDAPLNHLGGLDRLGDVLKQGVVDEVMICLSLRRHFGAVSDAVRLCRDLGVVVRLVPEAGDVKAIAQAQIEEFDGEQVVTFFRERLLLQLCVKRAIDVAGAAALIVALAPVFVLAAVLVKLSGPGPVFFRQERIGRNKRSFQLLKFRSMVADAEARKRELAHLNEMSGPVFKIRDDPRVTPVGRWLRKLSIDELPQLFNVLSGEMSLVGPRPPLPDEVDLYDWSDRRRLSVKPGITCLWQISGRNTLSFEQWMELDRKYIENRSTWLDLKILLKTLPVVLLGRGAS